MQFYRPAEQKKKEGGNPRKFFILGIILFFFILTAGLIYLVRFSNVFKIKDIEISGVQNPLSDQILADLKDYFSHESKLSFWLGSGNILSWNGNVEDFLKNHPQLSELKINENYFTRSIFVEAKERDKYGIWCQFLQPTINSQSIANANDTSTDSSSTAGVVMPANTVFSLDGQKCYWFDEEGVVFAESPVIESELFNRVSDLSDNPIKLGEKILPDEMFANLKKIFSVMNVADLNTKTVKLSDVFLQEVEVDPILSPKIYFSLKIDPDFSLSAINSLKKSGKWNKADYVDFRVENRAYYMLK